MCKTYSRPDKQQWDDTNVKLQKKAWRRATLVHLRQLQPDPRSRYQRRARSKGQIPRTHRMASGANGINLCKATVVAVLLTIYSRQVGPQLHIA